MGIWMRLDVEDLNDSLRAVVISEAAHHLDLFFSHQDDSDAVIEARQFEMVEVRKWVNEKRNTVKAKRQSITAETQ